MHDYSRYLFFWVLCFNNVVLAQNQPKLTFGTPNFEELQAKTSLIDTSAEAEILVDKEQIMFVVEKDYIIRTIYHGKIKILKKSGLDRGTIKLRSYVDGIDKEYINNIKGFTHNLENDGIHTMPLQKSNIFYEKLNEHVTITKIVAPNLKVGSVFEYQYTRNTPFKISMKPDVWNFQGSIPSRWSEIIAYVPAWFFYQTHYSGYLPLAVNEVKDTTLFFDEKWVPGFVYRYAVKDAPAIKQEDYMPSIADCIANVEFELSGYQDRSGKVHYLSATWKDVYRLLNYNENYGARIDKTEFLTDIARTYLSVKDTMEKIDAIYKYIANEMKWNGDFGLGVSSLLKAFEKKTGSGTEINMLLVALLRHADINAHMAIVSTRGNGKVNTNIASTDRFNHSIAHVRVGGKDIFMDATEKYAKPNMLPIYSISKVTYIVEPDTGRFVTYKPKEKRWDLETIQYELNTTTSELKGNYELVNGGYEAILAKHLIDEKGKDEVLKAIVKENSDWQLEDLQLAYKDREDGTVQLKYQFTCPVNQQADGRIYFNPLHELRFELNPFASEKRWYPIEFSTAIENISLIKFIVPQGYQVIDLPQSLSVALPDKAGKFSYSVELNENVLSVRSHLSLTAGYYPPEQYQQLRDFFNVVVDNQAKMIVIKKM